MDAKLLYDLTPDEFERFVAALLTESGYSDLRVVGGPSDKGIDIIGKFNNEPIAIQVKHKLHLKPREIEQFVRKYFSDPSTPRSLVFVTSAEVPLIEARIGEHLLPGQRFQLIDRKDIIKMLSAHQDVANQFFAAVKRRLATKSYQLNFGVIGIILSIIGSLLSSYIFFFKSSAPLDRRIQTVESAIASIRDLETYLGKIKQDMVDTEGATKLLNEKYAKAKELEKLTQEQVNALKETLQAENWYRTILNYAIGFFFGVGSSFVASVLYGRWRQRRALE
jgi:hypothetical protein